MKILRLKFKNFKSYGNKEVVLDFEKDFDNDLVLLQGLNGAGKSSIKDVIEFALYGKVKDFTKEDLPNRSNGNLRVYVKFKSKKSIVEIDRGLKPDYFRFKINGVTDPEKEQASKVKVQKWLEEEYIQMPQNVTRNVVALSINNFKSFLKMTPADKRNIIDKLFGFDILNMMNEEIKIDKKEIIRQFETAEFKYNSISNNIKGIKDKIDNYKEFFDDFDKKEVDGIKINITKIEKERETILTKFNSIKDEKLKITLKIDKGLEKKGDLKNQIVLINRSYSLYKDSKCSKCGSDLTTGNHLEKKEDYLNQMKTLKKKILALEKKIEVVKKNHYDLEDNYRNILSQKSELDGSLKTLNNQLVGILKKKETKNNFQKSSLDVVLKDYEESVIELNDALDSLSNERFFLERLEKMFSADGIKKMVVDNILPLLNNNIDDALSNLDTNFNVVVKDNFECRVTSLGRDISVDTLSTGERTRVDFAVIISLIKIIKLQYPSLNILFLDEIFSNIDMESINRMIEMVKALSQGLSLNIFLVSHTPVNEVFFDKKINIVKEYTFSNLIIEN